LITDLWLLIYPITLSILSPLIKSYYGGKVHDKPFSIVYSLAIFLPLYTYLVKRIVNGGFLYPYLVALFLITLLYHIISLSKIISFDSSSVGIREVVFTTSYVTLVLAILVFS
jgi:hypothetical protein